MRHSSSFAIALAIATTAKGAWGDEASNPPTVGAAVLKGVSGKVVVEMPRMPPTRTHCTFEAIPKPPSDKKDNKTDAGHTTHAGPVTLTWDPLEPGPLRRTLVLPGIEHQVTCHSDPARHSLNAEVDYAWSFEGLTSEGDKGVLQFGASYPRPLTIKAAIETGDLPLVDNQGGVQNRDKANILNDPSLEAVAPSPSTPLGAARTFGGLGEEAINELFQVVAEVVMEQVNTQGLRLLEHQARRLLCEVLVKDAKNANETKDAEEAKDANPWFPRSCELVKRVRFEDLAGSGRTILVALTADLVAAATDALIDIEGYPKELRTVTREIVRAALKVVEGKPDTAAGAGQHLLVALSELPWPKHRASTRYLFVSLAECHRIGGCDAAKVSHMLSVPQHYAKFTGNPPNIASVFPEAAEFILRSQRILRPTAGTTEVATLREAIDLALLLTARVVDADTKAARLLPHVRSSLDSALEQNLAGVVAGSAKLIEASLAGDDQKKALRKVGQLAGALGSYLDSYASGQEPSEADKKERHDARKEAIRSLIAAQTVRSERDDNWVVGIGSSVYIAGSGAFRLSDEQWTRQLQPVSLTLGVGLDYHGPSGFGVHAELVPLNLGAYLTVRGSNETQDDDDSGSSNAGATPVSPADAFSPSLTVGASYVFDDSNLMLILGPSIGYMPKLGDTDAEANEAFYVGGVFGAYVPIFDFN